MKKKNQKEHKTRWMQPKSTAVRQYCVRNHFRSETLHCKKKKKRKNP